MGTHETLTEVFESLAMKPASLTDEQRDTLKLFTDAFDRLHSELKNLSNEQLHHLLKAANSASQTNCWYVTYEAAQWLRPEIKQVLHDRKSAKAESDSSH